MGVKRQRKLDERRRVLGKYSRKDNPWNDRHLDKVFVWRARAHALGISSSEAKRDAKARREANLIELDKAKQRREAREVEFQERVAEKDRQRRERDGDDYDTLARTEKVFVVKQRKQASILHINANREEPADTLARNVLLLHQLGLREPETGPDGKLLPALAEFVGAWTGDVLRFVRAQSRAAVQLIKQDLPLILADLEPAAYLRCVLVVCEDLLAAPSVHLSAQVEAAIVASCQDRTLGEIAAERASASAKARGSDYWTAMASRLAVEEAKAHLVELQRALVDRLASQGRATHAPPVEEEDTKLKQAPVGAERKNTYSRRDGGDEEFDVRLPVANAGKGLLKPKTWNRVLRNTDRRGNQYVAGYRFNILYPEATTVPRFEIEPNPRKPTTCFLVFKAEPYEDLKYEVESKDWERNTRSNFVSKFENNTLQLYFDYRRVGFRR